MGDNQDSDQPSTQDVHRQNGNIAIPSSAAQPDTMEEVKEKVKGVLEGHIGKQRGGLKRMFSEGALDAALIKQATEMFTKLRDQKCPNEQALSLSILVLYDLVILIG